MKEVELRKPIDPYVCSSPDDFVVERKFLSDVIFPQINKFCLQRGAHFTPFDILWSETDDYFQNGHLLHFLLSYASKCSPFLICLLGERYGPYRPENASPLPHEILSIPDDSFTALDRNFLMAALRGHPWILEKTQQTASILELEIIQAAFLGENEYCNFYFRQREHIDEKMVHIDESEWEKSKSGYMSENEHAGLKVTDLKQRIVKKGLQVKYFKTIQELGEMVLDDWKGIIDILYPPLHNDGDFIDMEEYRESICQQSYIQNHLENYVGTEVIDRIISQLTKFALTENRPAADMNKVSRFQLSALSNLIMNRGQKVAEYQSVTVIYGDKGIGKSTVISKWLKRYHKDNPNVMIFSHFVGCSQMSTDIAVILRKFITEIKKKLKGEKDIDLFVELDQTKSFQELTEAFIATISSVPCLLIIDGIDELGGTLGQTPQEVKELSWLPFPLPSQCKLIVSTSRSDLTFHSLSKRSDVQTLSLRNIFNKQQKQLLLMEHMKNNYQRLTNHNLKQILDIKLTEKPLFLHLLASEMSSYKVFTNLTEFLDDHYELCSVREFWVKCLKRWMADHNWKLDTVAETDGLTEDDLDTIGWVPDVLRLILISKNGLTQTEILRLLHQLGYKGRREVRILDWVALRECIGSGLYEDTSGLFKFSHQHLTELVEYTLFKSVKQSPGEARPTEDATQKRIFHQHLALYFIKQPFSHRHLDELPWQLMMAGSFESLIKILTHDMYLPCLLDVYMKNPSDRLNLLYYWSVLIKNNYSPVYIYSQYLVSLGLSQLDIDVESVCDSTSSVLEQSIEIKELEKHINKNIRTSLEDGELAAIEENDESVSCRSEHITIESCLNEEEKKDSDMVIKLPLSQFIVLGWHLSQLLLELGYPKTTLNILIALSDFLYTSYPLDVFERLIFTRCLECAGNLYVVDGNQKEGYRFYKKALRSVIDLIDGDDDGDYQSEICLLKANMLNQLGKMKMKESKLSEAEDLFLEALDCLDEYQGDQSMTANIQYQLAILRLEQGDFVRAEIGLNESMSIREKRHGKCNILVSDNIMALARLYSDQQNVNGYDKAVAESFYRRALSIREKCLGNNGLLVAEVLHELGKLIGENYGYLSKLEAVSLLSRSLDIKTQYLGSDHIETKTVRRELTGVEVKIKLGQYEFGSAKPLDLRSKEYPYSNLSFREKDLDKVESKEKKHQNQRRLIKTRSYCRSQMTDINSQISTLSCISASDKVLLESERPPLIRRQRNFKSKSRPFTNFSEHATPVTGMSTLARREATAEIDLQDIRDKEKGDVLSQTVTVPDLEQVIDSYAMDVYNPNTYSPPPPVTHVKIAKVKNRPISAPLDIFHKYNFINVINNKQEGRSRRAYSALIPSTYTAQTRPISGSSHSSHCQIPGPDSVYLSNTQSVQGPHSSISSLLGEPPAPRDVSKKLHHQSAWYHVPGRYATSNCKYPPKRSQIRPGSASYRKGFTDNHMNYSIADLKLHQKSDSLHEIFYDVNEDGEIVPFPTNVTTELNAQCCN